MNPCRDGEMGWSGNQKDLRTSRPSGLSERVAHLTGAPVREVADGIYVFHGGAGSHKHFEPRKRFAVCHQVKDA